MMVKYTTPSLNIDSDGFSDKIACSYLTIKCHPVRILLASLLTFLSDTLIYKDWR